MTSVPRAMRSRPTAVLLACVAALAGCGSASALPAAPGSSGVPAPVLPSSSPSSSSSSSSSSPRSSDAVETCPAEAIRAAVTACADGEPPTYDEIRLAQAAVGNAMERDVLHPYYPFMGGVAVTKGPRQPVAERPLTGEEQHLVELYHRVTCRGRTRPQRNGLEMTRGEAFYGLGRLYRDASHWEEAAAAFHEDARAEGTESGIYSAQFSLEVLDVLAHRDDRQDCRDAVVSRARIYARAHCGDAKVDDDDWCRRLEAFPSRRDRFLDPYPR